MHGLPNVQSDVCFISSILVTLSHSTYGGVTISQYKILTTPKHNCGFNVNQIARTAQPIYLLFLFIFVAPLTLAWQRRGDYLLWRQKEERFSTADSIQCIASLIMSQKISKSVFKALADKIRENPAALQNLTFADASSSMTAIKTRDLRLDVHKNTQDPNMATGIIQANSEAKDKTVKAFIKGKTGSHKGTHQVIGQKIRFGLGYDCNVNEVAAAVENPDSGSGEGSSSQGGTGGSKSSEWTGESSTSQATTGDRVWEWDNVQKMNKYWDGEMWVYWDTEYSRGKYWDGANWQWHT